MYLKVIELQHMYMYSRVESAIMGQVVLWDTACSFTACSFNAIILDQSIFDCLITSASTLYVVIRVSLTVASSVVVAENDLF